MKKTIRYSVFETNSSSMHSLSWHTGNKLVECNRPLAGYFDEFGWEQDVYDKPHGKLAYLLTMIASKNDITYEEPSKDTYNRFMSLPIVQTVCNVVKEYTRYDLVIPMPDDKDFYPYGYIDHQSDDILDFIFGSEKLEDDIRNYLFNPYVCVETDNDNN